MSARSTKRQYERDYNITRMPSPEGHMYYDEYVSKDNKVMENNGHELSYEDMRKQVQGALICAIDAHGPIDRASASSAAKRIVGQLRARRKELL